MIRLRGVNMTKRTSVFRVTVDFKQPDGTNLRRRITEGGLTASSAVKKVAAYYRATDHTIVSVIKLTSTDGAEMALSVV